MIHRHSACRVSEVSAHQQIYRIDPVAVLRRKAPGSLTLGVAAALAAGAFWSLNFAAPRLIGPYTSFDLALVRFIGAAMMGFCILAYRGSRGPKLKSTDIAMTFWLGAIGYVGKNGKLVRTDVVTLG
jgi:drug/metabolite transporter (DMT)-like permease